eukprot:TRINITY_DN2485_c0_g1_i1.p1 TRINITY_DN2485_c0_g1~~TRINITY_DN2485_c0_g1_i1.p1  ORF type:complete len:989 (-),score=215.09 TRINITY_DN2485_c0_g1_i1:50-3016(-)
MGNDLALPVDTALAASLKTKQGGSVVYVSNKLPQPQPQTPPPLPQKFSTLGKKNAAASGYSKPLPPVPPVPRRQTLPVENIEVESTTIESKPINNVEDPIVEPVKDPQRSAVEEEDVIIKYTKEEVDIDGEPGEDLESKNESTYESWVQTGEEVEEEKKPEVVLWEIYRQSAFFGDADQRTSTQKILTPNGEWLRLVPWELTFKLFKEEDGNDNFTNNTDSKDLVQKKFDPDSTIKDVLTDVAPQLGVSFASITGSFIGNRSSEEWCLFVAPDAWLEDAAKLMDYIDVIHEKDTTGAKVEFAVKTIYLRRKPRTLRVSFQGSIKVFSFFSGKATSASTVLQWLGKDIGIPSEQLDDYGLFVETWALADTPNTDFISSPVIEESMDTVGGGSTLSRRRPRAKNARPPTALKNEGKWLMPEQDINQLNIPECKLRIRPRELNVVVCATGEIRNILLDFKEDVGEVLNGVCGVFGFSPANYSFIIKKGNGAADEKVLQRGDSLKAQGVKYGSSIFLKENKMITRATIIQPTTQNINIWLEPHENTFFWEEASQKPAPAGSATPAASQKPAQQMVGAASLNRLIEYLTSPDSRDADFQSAFLLTYTSFTTPETFLSKLKERFGVPSAIDQQTAIAVKQKVVDVCRVWIVHYQQYIPEGVFNSLKELFYTFVKNNPLIKSDRLEKAVDEAARQREAGDQTSPSIPQPSAISSAARGGGMGSGIVRPTGTGMSSSGKVTLHKDSLTGVFNLENLDEVEIARQMTFYSFILFKNIKITEFYNQNWTRPQNHLSDNLISLIEFFNVVARWVATTILQEGKIRNRVKLIHKHMRIAKALYDLHNFHLVMAYISGLNNSAVTRLKWTQAKVSKTLKEKMKEVEDVMNMEGSYKRYRQKISHSVPPCIPYLGLVLMDLTFMSDGNPDTVKGDLINFSKFQLMHKILGPVQTLQEVGYNNIQPVGYIQQYFKNPPQMEEAELYKASLELEPRNAAKADIV